MVAEHESIYLWGWVMMMMMMMMRMLYWPGAGSRLKMTRTRGIWEDEISRIITSEVSKSAIVMCSWYWCGGLDSPLPPPHTDSSLWFDRVHWLVPTWGINVGYLPPSGSQPSQASHRQSCTRGLLALDIIKIHAGLSSNHSLFGLRIFNSPK